MNKKVSIQKLAIAGVLIALSVVLSGFSIPIGASKCFPIQHMVNVIAGTLLGPWYAVGMAFITSLIRLIMGTGTLLAFPGSMVLKQTIADGRWWLVTGIMLLLCLVIYFFCSRLLRLCYQPRQDELHPSATDRALSWSALSLLAAAIGLGLWQPAFFRELIDRIASL